MATDVAARDIIHGGAERQPLRWRRDGAGKPDRLSWYHIAPGDRCAAHWHTGKVETWLVVAGKGRVMIGEETFDVEAGDAFVTAPGLVHAMWNTGGERMTFVNIVSLTGGPVATTEVERA